MQPISAAFQAALPYSHRIATRFEVWSGIGGQLLGTLNPLADNPGNVTEDVTNQVRRNLNLTCTDPTRTLVNLGTLQPYGAEIIPYRGITYPNGTTEMVPLGVFPINTDAMQDTGTDLVIQVSASDRSDRVARSKLPDVYQVNAATDLATAIKALIQARVPQLTNAYFNFVPTTGISLPLTVLNPGDDPWAAAQGWASDNGYDLYFDPNGVCTLTPVPAPTQTSSVWTYAEGATSMLKEVDFTYTNRDVFNHIIVLASGTGITTPLRAEAWDSNPQSPTYIGSGYGTGGWVPTQYGDVINVVQSSSITTSGAAQQSANAALSQSLGLTRQVTMSALVNPAHVCNDVVSITRQRLGLLNAYYVFNQLTIPFAPGDPLQGTLRLVTS